MSNLLLKFADIRKYYVSPHYSPVPAEGDVFIIEGERYRVHSVKEYPENSSGYEALVTLFTSNNRVISPMCAVPFSDIPTFIPEVVGIPPKTDF